MALRHDIDAHLDVALDVKGVEDYGPNGLQVEGRSEIRRLVGGVTASLAPIAAAIDAGADALLVHHGLFWRGHDGRLTGRLGERARRLKANRINLIAYLTGEISEPQAHLARETGVAFLACGHHATERFGAPAFGTHLAERFGLEHRFIDIANPA